MSDHSILYDLAYPTGAWECRAADDAPCRAVWDCECESITDYSVIDGVPCHRNAYDDQAFHAGRFDADRCNLRDWFEGQDECVEGEVRVDVTEHFRGDFYEFEATAATLITTPEADHA